MIKFSVYVLTALQRVITSYAYIKAVLKFHGEFIAAIFNKETAGFERK